MGYTVKVVIKQDEISDKEKSDRVAKFQQAFITAAVDYYSKRKDKQNTIVDKN